ncbi:FAD-dependent oxidoreductase [Siphonobacter sp. SORGH_AS_1065]|uniref:FAD-dependent oxidoreductase n=1 Tax=Siphonobacter sp. SORGH_AS_1065 TaxID=3041795 RepID=UPI0027D84029|nr:FAD-dependent oxidoreductase [Siphonobacter sp. SORGH_AS_1065]
MNELNTPKPLHERASSRDGANVSIWQPGFQPAPPKEYSSQNEVFDVLIVGGGITGLTAAVQLQELGKAVVIAESHTIGYGTTGGTSAHINTFADTTYAEVEQDFGKESAQLFAKAIQEAVTTIKTNAATYRMDCDLESKDAYVYAEDESQRKELDSLYESALRAGVEAHTVSQSPLNIPALKVIHFPHQAQFHPLKYIGGLRKVFEALGGMVLEHTRIEEIEQENDLHKARSGDQMIQAKAVIYATHIPPGGINALHFLNAPYRSYVLAVTLEDEKYPDALIYDMQEPYHYFRSHVIEGQRYLLIGGNDHKTGHDDPQAAFEALEHYTRQHFKVKEVAYQWSSQYFVPSDGLPYIGKMPGSPAGIYTATGYNGNGMILGTIAGKILSDLIAGKDNAYADLFDPRRVKPLAITPEAVKENVDVAYHFIADRLSTEELDSLKEVPFDTGMIAKISGKKVAVYKSPTGEIHTLSPVCPHAHCFVNWNESEKSWDCPCHGARFSPQGEVLTGPARKDLEKLNLP